MIANRVMKKLILDTWAILISREPIVWTVTLNNTLLLSHLPTDVLCCIDTSSDHQIFIELLFKSIIDAMLNAVNDSISFTQQYNDNHKSNIL